MPQDGALADVIDFERPSTTALKRIASEINFNKVLKWHDVESALEQFYALVEKPPLHSVVIEFAPAVAAKIVELTNTSNRPKQSHLAGILSNTVANDEYGLTGDTVKWGKSGVMLDGQHRLHGCINGKKSLITHVVFGIDDAVFDILDQGKKRSPGEILAKAGVQDYNIVAGAVRRAVMISDGSKGNNADYHLTARGIKDLALGKMRDIQNWVNDGRLVHKAFKHPPSMVAATLYLIAKYDKGVARDFAHEWVHGARIGRNKNFDVLNERLLTVARTGGGHINHIVRSAMIIQCFNYWHAGVVAKPIGLKYDKKWSFPKLVFNKSEFLKQREADEQGDTSLPMMQQRMLVALGKATNKEGNVELPVKELSKRSHVPLNQVTYVLDSMEDKGWVHCSRQRSPNGPAIWRLRDAGIEHLRAGASANGAAG